MGRKKKKIKIKKTKKLVKKSNLVQKTSSADEKVEIKKIKKQPTEKKLYGVNDYVVYPKHGVGEIKKIELLEVESIKTKFYVIQMEQGKLTIRVPLDKLKEVGLRKIASKKILNEIFKILKLKPKIRRIMWSRRAQEYDAKINSGDPVKIAEVIRDLFRKNSQPEQSYSERQMFQVALERLAREVAAVEKTDYFQATEKIENTLYNK